MVPKLQKVSNRDRTELERPNQTQTRDHGNNLVKRSQFCFISPLPTHLTFTINALIKINKKERKSPTVSYKESVSW